MRLSITEPRPDLKLARVAARNYGLFTRGEALACGLTSAAISRRLASGEWIRVYPNVYRMASVPVTWHQAVLAPCLRRPGAVWAFGRTAGRFWQLDGCESTIIEVVATCDIRSHGQVVFHTARTMPAHHVTIVNSIPVTTVHRTLADLGSVADAEVVEMALECALRRGITSPHRLWRVIGDVGTSGRRGAAILAHLLRTQDERPTESVLETKFVQFLRRFRLPPPSRQVEVRDATGLLARVDFFWDNEMVVVEVDSRSHHLRRQQWEDDLRRRNALTSRRYLVLHVTYRRLTTDPQGIAEEILLALARC